MCLCVTDTHTHSHHSERRASFFGLVFILRFKKILYDFFVVSQCVCECVCVCFCFCFLLCRPFISLYFCLLLCLYVLFCFVFFFEIPIVVTFRFCGIDFPKFFWLRFVITFHNKRSFSSSSLRRTLELGQVRAIFRVSFLFACTFVCQTLNVNFPFCHSLLFGFVVVVVLL